LFSCVERFFLGVLGRHTTADFFQPAAASQAGGGNIYGKHPPPSLTQTLPTGGGIDGGVPSRGIASMAM
jgi:hypothetical protein